MRWCEDRRETREWDAVISCLSDAVREASDLIETLRDELDEARSKVVALEDQLANIENSSD